MSKILHSDNQGVFKQDESRGHPFYEKVSLINDLVKKIQEEISRDEEDRKELFGEGINCEILEPGFSHWQTGKLRIRIEFCPDGLSDAASEDTPCSPLDQLRASSPESEEIYEET